MSILDKLLDKYDLIKTLIIVDSVLIIVGFFIIFTVLYFVCGMR